MLTDPSTRGPKSGICNICGTNGKLTEDHTPPKGCYKPKGVELHHIIRFLSETGETEKGRLSQNGVKYRTLCHQCNNGLLGATYDPEFIRFVNGISTVLREQGNLSCRRHFMSPENRKPLCVRCSAT